MTNKLLFRCPILYTNRTTTYLLRLTGARGCTITVYWKHRMKENINQAINNLIYHPFLYDDKTIKKQDIKFKNFTFQRSVLQFKTFMFVYKL